MVLQQRENIIWTMLDEYQKTFRIPNAEVRVSERVWGHLWAGRREWCKGMPVVLK
jgi:hypothetical protein